ncbi:hypothetical protein JRO89_XS08G0055100 [Xanthoceras sorbifolium]|uniref:WAT1-related protein n=1 Tax=Xanthoceras sorbifolium TaxID=99658 RepID=A0ABQ8HNR9_9ROSI|nr:hypothetical protein JRO89_XS08G0055100 [Xanthoceras sorbifolium]
MTEKLCKILREFKPIIVMVLIQLELAGVNLLYKLALDDGMSMRIMIAYRFIFTTACVVPLALIFERFREATVIRKNDKDGAAKVGGNKWDKESQGLMEGISVFDAIMKTIIIVNEQDLQAGLHRNSVGLRLQVGLICVNTPNMRSQMEQGIGPSPSEGNECKWKEVAELVVDCDEKRA